MKPSSDASSKADAKQNEYNIIRNSIYKSLIEAIDIQALSEADVNVARKEIRSFIQEIVQIKNIMITKESFEKIVMDISYDIMGFGPLEPLLQRDDIADIMINGAKKCYIETGGRIQLTPIQFSDNQQLMNICQRIVSQVGRRVDESNPICDARLLDGSRVNVIAPPLALDGPTLTIRKFKKDKLRMQDLIKFESISPEGGKLLDIIGHSRCNVIISGGTGSGKTTLLNCMTAFIENNERVITCEDSAELQLQQPHVVRLETRPPNLEGQGEVTMRDLVKNCLRMRPERIIVGEVRGPEAFDLLQAMNTGHDGSLGTLHANTPREALSRIESMITMGGFSLPTRTIREMIVAAVDVVIQASRLRDGSRRIMSVSEVVGMEGDVIVMQELIKYEITGETSSGKLVGRHVSTGIVRPKFWERAQYYGRGDELVAVLESMIV
ncbi:MAG: CpaF family protein [Pseudomonadota bacterium]